MGRKKVEPEDRPTYVTAGLYAEEMHAVNRTMRRWGITQSAAIRLLIRHGFKSGPPTDDN